MSDVELRDELLTLLTAGHETTATGLSWAFERLVRTPAVMARAVAAWMRTMATRTSRPWPRRRCASGPVIVDVARKVTVDWKVEGYDVPAGTLVMPAIGRSTTDPTCGSARSSSAPSVSSRRAPPSSWIPFGGGVRRCIGAAFALMEMRVVLRAVLERMELRATRPAPERPRAKHVTAVPGRGAEVVAVRRTATRARPRPRPVPSALQR